MDGFTIGEMLAMQRQLQDKYKGKWEAITPDSGKNKLLCYGISEAELKQAYISKFERNLTRW